MDNFTELMGKLEDRMKQNTEAIEAQCRSLGCQCLSCGAYTLMCCCENSHNRRLKCPDDPAHSPNYRCPDFKPKEEPDNAP